MAPISETGRSDASVLSAANNLLVSVLSFSMQVRSGVARLEICRQSSQHKVQVPARSDALRHVTCTAILQYPCRTFSRTTRQFLR